MRELVVIHRVLGVHPFAEYQITVFKPIQECILMRRGPTLEQSELGFSSATHEIVPTGLQAQLAALRETKPRVGSVHLFLDDNVLALKVGVRRLIAAVIASLKP